MEASSFFALDYKGTTINVQRLSFNGQTIFRVLFPGKSAPLVITRPINANAARFWTSIPEGRQKEAEEIGPLIAAFLQKK